MNASVVEAYAFSQGFDIVTTHSTRTPQVSKTFSCTHHGTETRNTRKLPPIVERNEEGVIVGKRKYNLTSIRQTDCPWACKVSYKSIGKRGSGQKEQRSRPREVAQSQASQIATKPSEIAAAASNAIAQDPDKDDND
jgi:hypothetical protein